MNKAERETKIREAIALVNAQLERARDDETAWYLGEIITRLEEALG